MSNGSRHRGDFMTFWPCSSPSVLTCAMRDVGRAVVRPIRRIQSALRLEGSNPPPSTFPSCECDNARQLHTDRMLQPEPMPLQAGPLTGKISERHSHGPQPRSTGPCPCPCPPAPCPRHDCGLTCDPAFCAVALSNLIWGTAEAKREAMSNVTLPCLVCEPMRTPRNRKARPRPPRSSPKA